MENVIRDIICEELKQKDEKDENASTATSQSIVPSIRTNTGSSITPQQTQQPVSSANRKKSEVRMSSLLVKMRSNTSINNKKSPMPSKAKKCQVKWSRYDPEKEKYEIVKAGDGGGYRFLKVDSGTPVTFGELKAQALDLFFDNADGSNGFDEFKSECITELCGQSGEQLFEDKNLWEHIESKGLFLSKTIFILNTRLIDFSRTDIHNFFDEIDRENIEQKNPPKEPAKRLICSVCSCTYLAGEECLRCVQNAEFDASSYEDFLNDDNFFSQVKEQETPITITSPKSPEIADDVSVEQVREFRLRNLCARETTVTTIAPATVTVTPETEEGPRSTHNIRIHRLKLRSDLMETFMKDKINLKDKIFYSWISPKGEVEPGTGSGVDRDVYSSFWKDVSDSFFIGEQERVPFVRHDLYLKEWNSIGNIILKGYIDTNYFPTFLSKAFLIFCLYGDVSDDILLTSFLNYLSKDERCLIKSVLNGSDVNVLVSDEFLEFLEQFSCRTLVNTSNVAKVITELARQELVQKVYLMASNWRITLNELKKQPAFSSVEAITKFYDDLEPTSKKLIGLFKEILPTNSAEREAFGYLKRYIRGLDSFLIKKLLKFLTGSDVLIVDYIEIIFTKPESTFSRRPIAHTCTPSLELPSTYNSYCELREEFSNILKLSEWEIDIV